MTGPVPLRPEVPLYNTGDVIRRNDTTPDVFGKGVLVTINIAPVTITQFDNGQLYQLLRILGDGNTTIANNANIKTNIGVNKLLLANKIYTFTLISGVWYENE